MNRYLLALFGTVGLCLVLLIAPYTMARGQETDIATSNAATIYLPSVFKNNGAVTPTSTLISTAPPRTPTLTGVETQTPTTGTPTTGTPTVETTLTPTATATVEATSSETPVNTTTSTATPTATPIATPTATPTGSPTGIATETATATPSATPTITSTPGPTPTATNTSIPYPSLTFTCAAEPGINDSSKLFITVSSETPVPSTASFRFDPTSDTGPIVNQDGQFALAVLFTDDTEGTAPFKQARCQSPNLCTITYTLTDSPVTRDIGRTVDCGF